MKWSVRIEARTNVDECRAFVDGVTAALLATHQRGIFIRDGSVRRVDVEITLKSNKRVRELARVIATILQPHCPDARVTLVAEVEEEPHGVDD
jgi:hypothetical protein